MTAASETQQRRDVGKRVLRATLLRMGGPWQTLTDLRTAEGAPVIPGPLLANIVATLVSSGMAEIGDEICVNDRCLYKVKTYALTAAGLAAQERARADLDSAPWTEQDAAHTSRSARRIRLP